jgi:2-oxo-4-hydroxy-4-carboxy--5-ureidoimidazoline (OHCU) decarboxylase
LDNFIDVLARAFENHPYDAKRATEELLVESDVTDIVATALAEAVRGQSDDDA